MTASLCVADSFNFKMSSTVQESLRQAAVFRYGKLYDVKGQRNDRGASAHCQHNRCHPARRPDHYRLKMLHRDSAGLSSRAPPHLRRDRLAQGYLRRAEFPRSGKSCRQNCAECSPRRQRTAGMLQECHVRTGQTFPTSSLVNRFEAQEIKEGDMANGACQSCMAPEGGQSQKAA